MTEITHKQAQRYLRAAADGLLRENQRALLDAHLLECDSCRTEADELSILEMRLKKNFQAKWDAQEGPSRNVLTSIHSRSRRIIMSNRINAGLKTVAGIAALIVLGFVLNYTFTRLRNTPIAANEPQNIEAASGTQSMGGVILKNHGLIAFTSEKDGNLDIYTMYADGSELTNLTNNPAHDINPYWAPDGKRIAFQSDRTGLMQLYVMNTDGSDVTQVTNNNEANHEFGVSDRGPWSPDGSRLLFTEWAPGAEKWMLYVIDVDGKNKTPIAEVPNVYTSPSWSPDGKHIAFIVPENDVMRIYSADADGNNLTNVTKNLPSDETLDSVNYYWSRGGQSISFIASNWNSLLGGSGEGLPNYKWMAYEASLDGNTLVTNATTNSPIGGYWDGTYFLSGSSMMSSSPAYTWVREKGTTTSVNPLKNCQKLLDSSTGGYASGSSSYKQSANGNVVIGAHCPNGDMWLFWANAKGTVRQLLSLPALAAPDAAGDWGWAPANFVWSPDDKYIAINIYSPDKTDLYIVNVTDALNDPSIHPLKLELGDSSLHYSPSWQPFIP